MKSGCTCMPAALMQQLQQSSGLESSTPMGNEPYHVPALHSELRAVGTDIRTYENKKPLKQFTSRGSR